MRLGRVKAAYSTVGSAQEVADHHPLGVRRSTARVGQILLDLLWIGPDQRKFGALNVLALEYLDSKCLQYSRN